MILTRLLSHLVPSAALCMTLALSPRLLTAQAGARFPLEVERVAATILERLQLTPGERVILVGHPQFARDLVAPLRLAIVRNGGVDLGYLEVFSEPWPDGRMGQEVRESAAKARTVLRELFRQVDAAIMLPGATSNQPEYRAMQDMLEEGHGRTIHFHWVENGSVVPIPGQPLPSTHQVDQVYQRALLETDYRILAERQERFVRAMRAGEVRVTTPAGTDLRFRIGDRPVNRQDGDASKARTDQARILIDREIELPAGALRVAPLEESVEGSIVFPISQWSGAVVKDLTLRFEAGRVVAIRASQGEDAVRREMDGAGPGGRAFREFALGFNPLLAVPETGSWIPYYGYGAGVVRLSLGDNSELGGTVTGGYVRWNFFEDATVTVNGHRWVTEGKLLEPGDGN